MKRKAGQPPSSRKQSPGTGTTGTARSQRDPEVLPKETELGTAELSDEEDTGEPVDSSVDPDEEELASSLPAVRNVDSQVVEYESTSTAVNDPLRRYLEEIRRYPLLEPEQELALVIRLKSEGDVNAAKTLVSANLRLVVKIAFEYRTFYSNLLDLIQEGNIGLMKAVSKFDPTRGARLGYYASWWIRSYILKYLLDNFRLVKIGTTQAQKKLFYHLMREKERLEAQGMLSGPKLLAERLQVREKDVIEMEQRLSGKGAEMSLDAPVSSGNDESRNTHADHISDGAESVDDILAREQLLAILSDMLPEFEKRLNEKEKHLLRGRLLSEEPMTLQEVADKYGLTRERARQIESKIISKLRDFLKDRL